MNVFRMAISKKEAAAFRPRKLSKLRKNSDPFRIFFNKAKIYLEKHTGHYLKFETWRQLVDSLNWKAKNF